MNSAPGIEFSGVSLRLGGMSVFEDLYLSISSGRWSCLLGQSGVGKTSLLRLIAGLARPDHGRIQCSDGGVRQGRIAYMAQQDLLLPWLSALDNVTLGARLRGEYRADHDRHARELLTEVGLAGAEQAWPHTLSGGMRQRVALARTLMEDRPIVLMDEPYAKLDVLTRLRLQDTAARLLAGRTVVLVTHDPLEALRLGHEVQVLSGRPARLLPPLSLPQQPPRSVENHELLHLHGQLLRQLSVLEADA